MATKALTPVQKCVLRFLNDFPDSAATLWQINEEMNSCFFFEKTLTTLAALESSGFIEETKVIAHYRITKSGRQAAAEMKTEPQP
jgi:DNA-binding PadR family transcriptional regulator